MKTLLVLILMVFSTKSFAFLGERKTSQAKSFAAGASTVQSYSTTSYVKDGTTITEYQDSTGDVFAVTWRGISHPDLSDLLGTYWDSYQQENRQSVRHLSKRTTTASSSLVVEKGGKMRDVTGRAYVPSLLPEGFNLNELL